MFFKNRRAQLKLSWSAIIMIGAFTVLMDSRFLQFMQMMAKR